VPSVIDRAVRALQAQGVSGFEATAGEVSVPVLVDGGFPVRLEMRGDREYLVRCEGWSHAFDRAEDAYDCFTFALCDQCRLQTIWRGGTAVEWQLQRREYGMWSPGRPVRRRLAPFWRRPRTEHRQNRVFTSETVTDDSLAPPPAAPMQE
jgi:hypothetical protein